MNLPSVTVGLRCLIPYTVLLLLLPVGGVCAQSVLKVAEPVWAGLSQPEKDIIQKSYLVEVAPLTSFGTIIDNQGVNESTPGTNGGAALGSAVANAAYIDTAIRGRDYSAKTQLGAIILGGILGSSLDSKGTSRFHQRYAVRLGDGNIQYFDEIGSDPFRHPVGVCVTVPNVSIASDQQLCAQSVALLRARFIGLPPMASPTQTIAATPAVSPNNGATALSTAPTATDSTELVNCKLNSLAPVRTTAEKCNQINGRTVE